MRKTAKRQRLNRSVEREVTVPSHQGALAGVPPAELHGSEIVVLVDDNADMRRTLQDVLEFYGYTVIAVGDGDQALALCESFHGTPDVLVTDYVMPRVNGIELIDALDRDGIRPRVLLMSGYDIPESAQIAGGKPYPVLLKPFPPTELATRIRELLGKPRKPRVSERRRSSERRSTENEARP